MPPSGKTPLIIAHRGSSAHAPENTLAAFKRAINDGAEGIEFDVRLTSDGKAVVFHDDTLRRTGRRQEAILAMTAEELAAIDVGSWFNLKRPARANIEYERERIVTLGALLDMLEDFKGLIYVELKTDPGRTEDLCRAVCDTIRDSPLLPQMIVKSFDLTVLPIVKRLCPEVANAALFGASLRNVTMKQAVIREAKGFSADQLSVHFSLATRRLVRLAKDSRLPVTIWTADDPKWVRKGAELGLKAVITNDPGRLLREKK